MLGSKPGAESGELIVLASGPGSRDRFAPVFDAVGRTIDLGDEPGAGTRMKLVLNHWVVALVEGLAETVLLAEGLELDPQAFLDIIDGGPMGPPYAKLKGANMIARSYEPNFSLKLAHKDAGLIAAAAEAAGIDLPLARRLASAWAWRSRPVTATTTSRRPWRPGGGEPHAPRHRRLPERLLPRAARWRCRTATRSPGG